jgi:flagellar assembly protein FliH
MTRLLLEALSGASGFRRDTRFAPAPAPVTEPLPIVPEPDPIDPVASAFAEGYEAGLAQALAEFAEHNKANEAAREPLTLALARIDAERAEDLASKLRETVAALCEATLAPLVLDREALAIRATRAAALLADADAAIVIYVNPEDLTLVAPNLGGDWTLITDPSLERGAIRVEGESGGIEDGPAQWRRAIAEALGA